MTHRTLLATERAPAINSYGFLWNRRADLAVRELVGLGYREFELMVQPPHLGLDRTGEDARALRAMVRGGEAVIHTLNMPSLDTNLASPFAEMRAHSVAMFKREIELAAYIGVGNIIVVPGRLSPLSPAPKAQLHDWLVESLSALIPFARDNGVRLLIENIPFAALPAASDILTFLGEIDDPVLGTCYDVANAHFFGEDPVAGLRMLREHLSVVHASDTTRQIWRHDPLGMGDVDIAGVVNALDEIAYRGPFILEIIGVEPIAAIRQSHEVLRSLGRPFAFEAHQ
ncbi:xylose isomerase domain-containing protein [Nitratireductor indicus C115]|uniref:Xylose isomerase domain-containing protein n=1 Tax=Nitratireductor indicus C115 TaxID=1231190 RepID=K2MX44_9HYPH|nr:sugar phosphate isomerase/epimerase family protein [Nitratireductor indicus]EKF39838.1 xylose isomerase domain-containing protein [Nitratireductor indicus C115]SFQ82269.1 Sugar phosphate isomerase/epimerase [Nitratireductor indicus]